jgi:ATP-dependent DNA ligase
LAGCLVLLACRRGWCGCNDLTRDFGRVAEALKALDSETVVDGEIVALD